MFNCFWVNDISAHHKSNRPCVYLRTHRFTTPLHWWCCLSAFSRRRRVCCAVRLVAWSNFSFSFTLNWLWNFCTSSPPSPPWPLQSSSRYHCLPPRRSSCSSASSIHTIHTDRSLLCIGPGLYLLYFYVYRNRPRRSGLYLWLRAAVQTPPCFSHSYKSSAVIICILYYTTQLTGKFTRYML